MIKCSSFACFCYFNTHLIRCVCLFVCLLVAIVFFGDCAIAVVSASAVVGLHCLFNSIHPFSVIGILVLSQVNFLFVFFAFLPPCLTIQCPPPHRPILKLYLTKAFRCSNLASSSPSALIALIFRKSANKKASKLLRLFAVYFSTGRANSYE